MNRYNLYIAKHQTTFLLILIFTGAFLLRIWGVNFGLPELFHFDERILSFNALYAMAHKGKLMSAYLYGNLIPYLLGGLYGTYYVILKIAGTIKEPFDFFVLYINNPTNIYLIGRIFFVACSTFCVFALYLMSKKIYSNTIALIATILFSFSFLPIQQSKFMKGDTLGTLFLLLAFYFLASTIQDNLSQKSEIKKYILAGVFMGLAIASRFTLWVGLLSLIFMCLTSKSKLGKRVKNCFILGFTSVVVFLIVTPSLLLEFHNFMASARMVMSDLSCYNIPTGGLPTWLFYLTEHLHKGIGLPLEIVAIIGILYSLYKKEDIGFIIFLVLFFIILNQPANFERYLIPTIPFLILFAAKFMHQITSKLKVTSFQRNIIIGIITIGLILPNLLNTIKYNYLITQPDTRIIARKFIESTIQKGSKIVSESGSPETFEQTSHSGVQLHKSKQQLQEQLMQAEKKENPGRHIKALIEGQSEPTYVLENILILEKEAHSQKQCYGDVNPYLERKVEYLITSSWAKNLFQYNSLPESFTISLNNYYELIKEFKPFPVFRWDYYSWRIDYEALSKVSIFNRKTIGGPIIRIYKIKNVSK